MRRLQKNRKYQKGSARMCYTDEIRMVSLDLFWNGDTEKYAWTRRCLSVDDRPCEERKPTEAHAFG
jgi:hypothetical protein